MDSMLDAAVMNRKFWGLDFAPMTDTEYIVGDLMSADCMAFTILLAAKKIKLKKQTDQVWSVFLALGLFLPYNTENVHTFLGRLR